MVEKLSMGEDGQGLIEYVLILALVVLVVVVAITIFGQTLADYYNKTDNELSSALK